MKTKINLMKWVFLGGAVSLGFMTFADEDKPSMELEASLERAIYLQEGRADLEGASRVYQDILKESELVDSLAAEARYRLATLYLEQGKKAMAMHLLDEIVQSYPEEQKWVEEAKSLLPQEFAPEITPWADGEWVTYDWLLASGDVIGRSFSSIYRYEWEGRALWRKESRYMLNGNRATALEFDAETFETAYSDMQMDSFGNVRAWYDDGGKSVKVAYSKSGDERKFNFPDPVVDNEQAYELMRQMPVEVGFKMAKTIFVSFAGTPVGITFEVVGIENLETAIGVLECYEVEIDLVAQKQSAFITTDERRLLVKMVVGGIEGILTSVDTIDVHASKKYFNPKFGYELEMPGTWGVFKHVRGENTIFLAEPMARGDFVVTSRRNEEWKGEEALSLDVLKRFAEKEMREDLTGFEYDEDWAASLSLGGLPTVGLKFERSSDEYGEEAYGYVAMDDKNHYLLVTRVPSDDREELLENFESIVRSFRAGE